MSKLVLKIYCGDWENYSRDKRELSVCQELGMKTIVMSKGDVGDKYKKCEISGFQVLKFSTRPVSLVPVCVNRFFSIFSWAHYARKLAPDIISGHDMWGLSIGWLSNCLRKSKATLVYDSHEFEIGRNKKRNRFQLWFITHMEGFLMKRCVFSIMVNDAIADEVQRIHKLEERPIVVRSTPTLWKIDAEVCSQKRKEMLSGMKEPKDFLMMYHGGVMSGRGIETLLELVSKNSNVCAVILGNGEEKYQKSLRMLADNLGITERVVFLPAVPIEELWKYAGAADVGMILAPAVVKNHLYSLPNKFFENIQSETPVICPEYPAMKPIVDRYQIGLTCDPTNIESINSCVERLRTDKTFYQKCVENTRKAKQELCWEKEKKVLLESLENVYD